MKIFAYVGSRHIPSSTLTLTERFIKNFMDICPEKPEVKIYTPLVCNLNECAGCGCCFDSLTCAIQDDIHDLLNEILASDIIVLASPVYFHAVTGSMKIFIDRLSCLTHILGLIGKLGVCIDVSESNGNSYVQEYLSKVLSYLGSSVITALSFQRIQSEDIIERKIAQGARKLYYAIQNRDFPITPVQENLFSSLRLFSRSNALSEKEIEYWFSHYLDCKSLRDAFEKNATL